MILSLAATSVLDDGNSDYATLSLQLSRRRTWVEEAGDANRAGPRFLIRGSWPMVLASSFAINNSIC